MLKTVKRFSEQVFKDLSTLGGSIFYAFVLGLSLLFGEIELFTDLLVGFFFTLLVIVLIRTFYFKDRPKKEKYNSYIEKIEASSFPSWHSARIIFLALMFSYFFVNRYVTGLLILTSLAVAYSRIHLKRHDWIDILGGIVLGVVTFLLVFLI